MCFANPGTSEMHFVAALDSAPQMRAVLCLFEGVATGAADGYARMPADRRPRCSTLGRDWRMAWRICTTPGGRAARSSTSSATTLPITKSLMRHCNPTSMRSGIGWRGTVHRPASAAELGNTVDAAIAAATYGRGRIATLILPADLSWSESSSGGAAPRPAQRDAPSTAAGGRSCRSSHRATQTAKLPRN